MQFPGFPGCVKGAIVMDTLPHLAIAPTAAAAPQRDSLLRRLSPRRLARIARYPLPQQLASLAADRLARELGGTALGLEPDALTVEQTPAGRPFFPGASCYLSLSHGGDYAAAALSPHPVGLDLERLRPISAGVQRRLYSEAELSWAAEAPEEQEFRLLRLWTMKEAYAKLLGQGFWAQPVFTAVFQHGELCLSYPGLRFGFAAAPEGYVLCWCLGVAEQDT